MNPEKLRLYLVTDRPLSLGRDLEWIVEEAVKGGATIVQLREKSLDTREFIELGLRLKRTLAPYGVPLIINDRVDVALAVDADGVHIGQSDMPYEIARRLLGPDKIIGLSVENPEEVVEANALDVDYLAVSPVYGTPTKTDTAPPFGLEGLRRAVRLASHPVVAIGGMNERTAPDVFAAGADGIAVVSAIVIALLCFWLYVEMMPQAETIEFVQPVQKAAEGDPFDAVYDPETGALEDNDTLTQAEMDAYQKKAEEIMQRRAEREAEAEKQATERKPMRAMGTKESAADEAEKGKQE